MKTLLTAINAKYIHTNIAVRLIKGYAENHGVSGIEIAEFTINEQIGDILRGIVSRRPQLLGFSCYIWNIGMIRQLCVMVKTVLPDVKIVLGGPEVSYRPEEVLRDISCDYVISGAGEEAFSRLIGCLENGENPQNIGGVSGKSEDGSVFSNKNFLPVDMSILPFPYEDLGETEHKICYYEASRGCPFGCSYCLSSADRNVQFAPIEKVRSELKRFIDARVKQVKFVDRSFNCRADFSEEIIRFIIENDNGITNFHFEIEAMLITESFISLMNSARRGLFQLEIGVQTVNAETLAAVHRKSDFSLLSEQVRRLLKPQNVHIHLDLIAGLPLEDFQSFRKSFDSVAALMPHQLQLGFLKVLRGSGLEADAQRYGIKYSPFPPYEVLSTDCLSYEDICRLKQVESACELFVNSGRYCHCVDLLMKSKKSLFDLLLSVSEYAEGCGKPLSAHNKLSPYELLISYASECTDIPKKHMKAAAKLDFLLHERPKNSPDIFDGNMLSRDEIYNALVRENLCGMLENPEKLTAKELFGYVHLEKFPVEPFTYEEKPTVVLFDYRQRDMHGNSEYFLIGDKINEDF